MTFHPFLNARITYHVSRVPKASEGSHAKISVFEPMVHFLPAFSAIMEDSAVIELHERDVYFGRGGEYSADTSTVHG